MKLSILILTFASALAQADIATFKVEGMHCGGCKKMVTKAVCDDKKIGEKLSKCEVSVDMKKQIGTVIVEGKNKAAVDTKEIEKAIQSAGEDYKITLEPTTKK